MIADDSRHGDLPVDPDLVLPAESPAQTHRASGASRRWDVALVIALGGAIGGGIRWLINEAVPHATEAFPWATFIENVSGCLMIGVLLVYLLEVWSPHRYARPFLGIGVLGGFTTFSAYTSETAGLLRTGHAPSALIYLFATVALGLLATWTGIAGARKLSGVISRTKERTTP